MNTSTCINSNSWLPCLYSIHAVLIVFMMCPGIQYQTLRLLRPRQSLRPSSNIEVRRRTGARPSPSKPGAARAHPRRSTYAKGPCQSAMPSTRNARSASSTHAEHARFHNISPAHLPSARHARQRTAQPRAHDGRTDRRRCLRICRSL